MSLRRLGAGCVLAGFDGHEPPDWLRRALADGLGGVCLFAGNVRDEAQVAALTGALRAERSEVLVAVDEDGGDVTRSSGGAAAPIQATSRSAPSTTSG